MTAPGHDGGESHRSHLYAYNKQTIKPAKTFILDEMWIYQ